MKEKIVILGAGESGVGAALLAKQQGFDVFVSDGGKIKSSFIEELQTAELEFEQSGHSYDRIEQADFIVKSPGIPENCAVISKCRSLQKDVISEIEFASRYTKSDIIAITGSNGKTTTTSICYQLFADGGLNVKMAGNIGNSFAREVYLGDPDVFVLEVSSFQLDDIKAFKPKIAILTNITPDHLDRYNYSFDQYTASKFRIAKNQDHHDFFIYNADEEHLNKWLIENPIHSTQIPFSYTHSYSNGAFVKEGSIHINLKKKSLACPYRN